MEEYKKCKDCSCKNYEELLKRTLEKFKPKKESDYETAIMNILNTIESHSCLNCQKAIPQDTQINNEMERDNTLFIYYCENKNGAKILREKKFKEIIKEVKSTDNEYFTGEKIGHSPNIWEEFCHYLLNQGLQKYWEKHLEYLTIS